MGGVNEIKSPSPLSNEGNPLLSRKKVEKKRGWKRDSPPFQEEEERGWLRVLERKSI